MSDFTDSLQYKFGPLPAWAWGVGLGVTVLAVQYVRRGRGKDGNTAPATDTVIPLGSDPFGTAYTATPSPMGGGSWAVAPTTDPTGAPSKPLTNDDWRRQAADYLVSQGYGTTVVADALVKYLDGDPMTDQEIALISAAIRFLGVPPQSAPSIRKVTGQPAAPGPAPLQPAGVPLPWNGQTPGTMVTGAAGGAYPTSPVGLDRRWLTLANGGTRGEDVASLQQWLNAEAGGHLDVTGVYDPPTDTQVDAVLRYLNNGVRSPDAGPAGGVNDFTWGLFDYISELRRTRRP